MFIRKATINDYELVLSMVLKFAHESPYSGVIDINKIGVLIQSILDGYAHNSVIFIDGSGHGFIAGCVTPHIFLTGSIASELAWWVEQESRTSGIGSELITAFETWAKETGCSYVSMSSLDDKVGTI